MKKILYFLIISFIFFITFSFSHIFYLFGNDFILNIYWRSWYEWIKSSIVVIYWILFLIRLSIYLFKNKLSKNNSKVIKIVSLLIWLMIISTLLSINIDASLFWIFEKYHSLLFYISLLLFFTSSFLWLDKVYYYKIINFIIVSSIFVYIYSFFQFLWLDPLNKLYSTELNNIRSTSFFWNANYLAWYILILLPIYSYIKKQNIRILVFIISFLALLTTWSYFGIFLWILYFIYYIFKNNKKLLTLTLISFIIFCTIVFSGLPDNKKWSLIMRPYIWQTTILTIIDKPKTILIWNWPETMQLIFDKYIPSDSILYKDKKHNADRSHNIFLDFIYFFWIIWWGLITFLLFKSIIYSKNKNIKSSLLLFIIFFSLNIPISIHYIIILFLIAIIYNS